MNLRKHQAEGDNIARAIADKALALKIVVAMVTPGGGKTLLASIMAHILLNGGIVDRVCWVCPRTSLVTQVEEGFAVPALGLAYALRAADNSPPLVRNENMGCRGYVTTYQAIAANPDVHLHEFKRFRYFLILDEPHHLCDDEAATWRSAVNPLMDLAVNALLMSGTLERHDRKRIPHVEYVGEPATPVCQIRYSRVEALEEKAILPVDFQFHDGWVKYLDGFVEKQVDISKAATEDQSKVIRTFLSQASYRDALLHKGLDHWLSYTVNVYASRCIVVCDSQNMAREITKIIQRDYQVQVALAISDDPDAQRTVRDFRRGERGKVLVTVGMAYEGLDVPDCTHLVCLTGVRSIPWLGQCFARVTRVDPKCGLEYSNQRAFIFVPDDERMREAVEQLRAEQAVGLRAQIDRDAASESDRKPAEQGFHIGLGAGLTSVGYEDWQGRLADNDSRVVELVRLKFPNLQHLAPRDLVDLGRELIGHMQQPSAARVDDVRPTSLSEREHAMRKAIQNLSTSNDRNNGWDFGTTNKKIVRRFGQPRDRMSISEMENVVTWLNGGAVA